MNQSVVGGRGKQVGQVSGDIKTGRAKVELV
jgi:hypothetical protein